MYETAGGMTLRRPYDLILIAGLFWWAAYRSLTGAVRYQVDVFPPLVIEGAVWTLLFFMLGYGVLRGWHIAFLAGKYLMLAALAVSLAAVPAAAISETAGSVAEVDLYGIDVSGWPAVIVMSLVAGLCLWLYRILRDYEMITAYRLYAGH
jgi:hypothetical protein